MAVRLSRATGNWLTGGTWGLVDSTSYNNSESTTTALTTSYQLSSTFTPGAIVLSGIAVKLSVRTGITGTISVALDQGGSDVVGSVVTINTADLPVAATADLNGGWIFFKFAVPVTLLPATLYSVKAKTSSASQVSLFSTATTNWARALVTTTTGAPAAGDDVIVCGEYLSAGSSNTITVTMDETATTDYGAASTSLVTPSLAICSKGVLSYGVAASTNYYLRQSGHVIIYSGGTFNIGSVGAEIPRDSSATLNFDCGANVDFGLTVRNLGTFNANGLSRTSGKDIVSCKLSADPPANILSNSPVSAVTTTNGTTIGSYASNAVDLDPTGNSLVAGRFTDNATSGNHGFVYNAVSSVTNITQTFTIWLARGSGTNNRFVRMQLGNQIGTMTNGFYADIDLQAGTIGSCTAVGNGTATSSSITALGSGFICTITGKASSAALTPTAAIMACSASGTISYSGNTTNNVIWFGASLFTGSSPTTDLNVDADTGWLTGDVIGIATTSRVSAECEIRALSSGAGVSTLSLSEILAYTHSGTSPAQGEVVLLSRNVQICGASASLQGFIDIKPTATFVLKWCEVKWLGSATANKRGIDIATTTGSCSVTYCSLHDFTVANSIGFNISATSGNGFTLSNNTSFKIANMHLNIVATSAVWTVDSNVFLRTTDSAAICTVADVGGVFTNNRLAGSANLGMAYGEANAVINSFSGNVSHSNSVTGINFNTGSIGTITNTSIWRNNSGGLTMAGGDYVFDTLTVFGNNSNNISFNGSGSWVFINATSNGDTSFATASGLLLANNTFGIFKFISCSFGVASGILTAHTQDINAVGGGGGYIYLNNCVLASSTEVANQNTLLPSAFISSQKHDQTAGLHKTWKRYGTIQIETSTVHTGGQSIKLTPNNASFKLESGSFFVAVASGSTLTPTVYVREDASYVSSRARLILKRNDAIGVTADTVIATATSASDGAWEAISGTTIAATDDGVMEFVIDCDGTAGNLFIDSFSVA